MNFDDLKKKYGKKVLMAATALAAALLGALAQYLGVEPKVVHVEKEVTVEKVVIKDEPPPTGGWVNDPDEVKAIADTLPVKAFGDTPAGKIEELPKFHYCWEHYQQLFARPPPVKDQGSVGSCVSFGTDTAIERTLAGEIIRRKGGRAEWSLFTEEATYGGSRVQIGGGRIRGDGSVGAWAAQFVTKFGCVPRKKYDSVDLTNYSESLCRKWGGSGVPAEFQDIARKFPVKSFVQVKVWEEAKAAIAQDYCIAVCSDQGFANKRDANGVARASGSWAHCVPYGTMISTQIPKPCQDVRTGDMVVGHDGRLHAVRQVHVREYDDDLVTLKIDGMVPTSFTLHHPVLVYRPMRAHGTKFPPGLALAVYSGGKYAALVDRYAAWEAGNPVWLAAEEVMDGDYVLSPKLKGSSDVQMPLWATAAPRSRNLPVWSAPTDDLAWLSGLYIADGNAVAGHRVIITLGKSETASVERACRAWRSLGLSPRLIEKDTFTRVIVDSAVVADSFREWFGTTSADKHIPEFLYHGWNMKAVLDGITDGDGCVAAKGKGYAITTTSNRLALQVHQLLLTHGERPAMQCQPRNGGEFPNAAPAWTVTWQPSTANSRMRHWGDYYLMPVRAVSRSRYTGLVWNYEIDEVHTYLTNNIVSHNCMALDGYHTDERGKEYGHIVNSWGTSWISGPVGWGSPGGDGFWAEASVIDRMLRQGDSWAFSGVTGFPARKPLDWNVMAEPKRPRDALALRPHRDLAPPSSLSW